MTAMVVMEMGRFLISTDRSKLDVDVIHKFLTRSYWAAGIPRATVVRAIENSLCFGVYDNADQIGFARIISDFATYAYVADVFILEQYRERGLGKELMASIMAHPDLQGLRRWSLATRDAQGLYAQFGFEPVVNTYRARSWKSWTRNYIRVLEWPERAFYITSVRDRCRRLTPVLGAARSAHCASPNWRHRWISSSAPKTKRFARSSAAGSRPICPKPEHPKTAATSCARAARTTGSGGSSGTRKCTRADGSESAGPRNTAAAARH